MEREVLTVSELAARLAISETIAYRLTKTTSFPVLRIGRKILIPKDGLQKWITENSHHTMEGETKNGERI